MIGWWDALAATAATVLCVSWVQAAWSNGRFPARSSSLIAGSGAMAALAHTLQAVLGPAADIAASLLIALGALVAVLGLVGLADVVRLSGSLRAPVAEAMVVGTSVVAILWALVGPPLEMSGAALGAALLTALNASGAALMLRLPVSSRLLVVNGRLRRALVVGGCSLSLLALAAGTSTLASLGIGLPGAVPLLLAGAGYLTGAYAPWVGDSPAGELHRDSGRTRYLPSVLVVVALVVVVWRALTTGVGAMGVLLAVLIVTSLVSALGLALRDNSALVSDLEASQDRLEALVENTSDVIVRLDAEGTVVTANAATSRLLHLSPSSLVGRPLVDVVGAKDRRSVREAVLAVARGRRQTASIEMSLAAPATGTAELRLRAVPDGAVGNLHDVTDAVRLRGRLERMARFDQMTGLANRAHLLEVIGGWLSLVGPVSVLYCDLDGFKAVNDRFGHLAGDSVLVEVAQRLRRVVGPASEDVVAGRIGGDEFVVALRARSDADVADLAARVVRAMRPAVSVVDRTVGLGMSIGIASRDDGAPLVGGPEGAADLLHRAELAMLAAKERGRSHVARWDRGLDQQAQRRVDIAIGLRRALDTGTLALAYQPMVRLADGVIVGMEALVRVPGGDRSPGALAGLPGLVSPAELVEVAEDTGAINEMGHWVLAEATRQAAYWRALGHDVRVAVNMSVRQLAAEGFEESVARLLSASGLPADQLMLEITESRLVGETGPALTALQRLRALGVVLAIDDFGTGYSSLAYLRRLPVRVLKIDRTLLDGLGSDPKVATLVRAVVGMARALGLLVVAEGLEDLETARLVRDLGAYAGQGFAISPAVAPEVMTALLEESALDLDAVAPRPRRVDVS